MGFPIYNASTGRSSQATDYKVVKFTRTREIAGLIKQIHREWNALAPEALAEKIVSLEGRVAHLPPNTPGLEKAIRQVGRLHFQFVFPIVEELLPGGAFVRTIGNLAKRILRSGSPQAFQELSPTQRLEVLRGRVS